MKTPVIVRARRTPFGRFLGALSSYSALDLALAAGRAVMEGIDPAKVDMVILGNVLPPLINVARQTGMKLGIPEQASAFTVNMACASGLKAVALASDAIRLGQADAVLCGGTESMTNSPHFLPRARTGYRLSHGELQDSLLLGLTDPVIGESMPQTAERLAATYSISREQQDAFALRSHQRAVAASKSGMLSAEIVSLPELATDEHPREDTSLERLAQLKPMFPSGTVTAGNASGINDGAALLLLCSEEAASRNGWKPLARFSASASAGCDPRVMGIGPVHAIRRLCQEQNLGLNDFDTIEINEAFASQTLACASELQLSNDESRLNRCGGGIAVGHPVGASGARLAAHLAHAAANGEFRRGLASLCVGGGMGIAAVIEPLE